MKGKAASPKGKMVKAQVLKGKEAAMAAEKKGGRSKKTEESEDEEEDEEEEEPKKKTEAQEANCAVREAERKQKYLQKLEQIKEALAAKLKSNNAEIRKAQAELEELDSVAKKKSNKVKAIKKAKLMAITKRKEEKEAAQAEREAARARKAKRMEKKKAARLEAAKERMELRGKAQLKFAKKRLQKAKDMLEKSTGKTESFSAAQARATAKLQAAEATIKALKAKGEEVPADNDNSWKYVAAAAWKPPGVAAVQARAAAKEELALIEEKMQRAKTSSGFKDKEARVKELQEAFDDLKQELKAKAEGGWEAAAAPKPKAKAKAKAKATISSPTKSPAKVMKTNLKVHIMAKRTPLKAMKVMKK